MMQAIGKKQSGAALIFMAFILGLAVTAYLLKSMNAASLAQQQDEKTYKALGDAKAALIAWSVSHKDYPPEKEPWHNPGEMPWPDRNSDDGGYDGSSDCVNGSSDHKYLLGQLPSMPATNPCLDANNGKSVYRGLSTYPGLGQAFLDGQGNRLWYAVSRNLVRDYVSPSQSPIINPGIANAPYDKPPYLRKGGTTPYPWLIVKDRNGVVVSDRVAVVLIAPGPPISNQKRSAAAPTVENFLDTFQFKADAALHGNADYTQDDEDFFMADDSKNVPATDTTYKQPYYFNDKLVYITIDELLEALQKRVGEVAKASLNKYFATYGHYPAAANLDAGAGKKYCLPNKFEGGLPLDIAPDSYSCRYLRTSTDSKITCSFNNISTVSFTRTTGSFSGNSGACTISSPIASSSSGSVCTCTGAGSCSNGAAKFECSATGVCATTGMADDGSYTISGGVFSSVTFPCSYSSYSSSSCAPNNSSVISCSSANSYDVIFKYDRCTDAALDASTFPAWFKANLWQDYIYYRIPGPDESNSLLAGKVPATAIVVTVGPAIAASPFAKSKEAAQVQPSCNLNDYLDSVENTNGDTTFEASNKIKSKNYNDQIFLLKP